MTAAAAAAAYGKNEVAPEVVKHADLAAAFLSILLGSSHEQMLGRWFWFCKVLFGFGQ